MTMRAGIDTVVDFRVPLSKHEEGARLVHCSA